MPVDARILRGPRVLHCLGLLALLSLVPACTDPASESLVANGSGILRVQLGAQPVSLVPWQSEDGASMKVLGNTWELLVGTDISGRLEPRIASKWTWDRTAKILTFELRPDAKWSDGEPVVASQFVDGLQYALAPQTRSKTAALLNAIVGAQALQDGVGAPKSLGVVALGPQQLRVTFVRPTPNGVRLFTLLATAPLRREFLSAEGVWKESAPSTGRYRMAAHRPEQGIQLEANPVHWAGRPAISRVHFKVVGDDTTGVHLFESGDLEILSKVPTPDIERIKKRGVLETAPFLATYYLAFNVRKKTVVFPSVRRAIARAIDREGIVRALGTGERFASSWVPPLLLSPGAAPIFFGPPEKGHLSGSPAIEISYDSSSRNATILEKVQADLKSNLGLRVQLTQRDWKSHIQNLQTDPPALFRFGWLAPFWDPLTHLAVFTSQSRNNYTGWKSSEYDRLVAEAWGLADGFARDEKIRKAQEILLVRDSVVIPIYHYVQNHAVSSRVSGFAVDPFGVPRLAEVKWK